MDISRKILSDIIVFTKYARFLPDLKRRETWDEIVDRNMNMHIRKFPQLKEEIENVYNNYVRTKKVLPSMRSLQFAGKPIEISNNRIFNCAYLPIDDYRAFSELMFLLLGGSGVGYSVQKHHVNKLPEIKLPTKKKRYLISDSIEGWADAVKMLCKAYFLGEPMPNFDFRDIRQKGALLVTSGGKAPGPEPLKDCLHNLKKIFDRKKPGEKLSTLEVHDMCCYIADAVLAGGIRRCLPFNSKIHTKNGLKDIQNITTDDEVLTYDGYKKVLNNFKQGKQKTIKILTQLGFFECTPNHKLAVLSGIDSYEWKEAGKLTKKDRLLFIPTAITGKSDLPNFYYDKLKKSTICVDITIPKLTSEVAYLFGLISGDGYVFINKKDKKNNKVSRRGKISIACSNDYPEIIQKAVEGFRLFGIEPKIKNGDGDLKNVTAHSYQLALYFSQWKKPKQEMIVPEFILNGSEEIRGAYLAGLFDSDGCAKNRPVRLVNSIYPNFIKTVQNIYFSLGIACRLKFTERKEKNWKTIGRLNLIGKTSYKNFKKYIEPFSVKKIRNDNTFGQFDYTIPKHLLTKDIKGTTDRTIEKVNEIFSLETKYLPIKILDIIDGNEVETYDLEVSERNEFVCEGLLVHNSAMISFFNMDDYDMLTAKYNHWYETNPQRGRANNSAVILRHKITKEAFFDLWNKIRLSNSGEPGIFFTNDKNILTNPCGEASLRPYTFCNLTEINQATIVDQEDFNNRAKAAAFIGTLQASYTDFHYLREEWKEETEKDALLGVGLTGIASPNFFNLNFVQASKFLLSENERVAKLIGINKAARIGLVKPSGTSSIVLGTSSGIHAWYAPYYIRRVRLGKDEAIYKYLKRVLPDFIEDDYFKPKTQAVLSVPQKAPEGSIFRNESPIDLLERVKRLNIEWITPTHRRGSNKHNISCTISMKNDDWDKVGKWMWDNREFYNGLSVLPDDGHTYVQMPFEEIDEKKYEEMFSKLKDIDLSKVKEDFDNTNLQGEQACAGGACEII